MRSAAAAQGTQNAARAQPRRATLDARRTAPHAGNNCLSELRAVSRLTCFGRLQLLNLAGNPLAAAPDYAAFVLSHLQGLVYLDYRCAC